MVERRQRGVSVSSTGSTGEVVDVRHYQESSVLKPVTPSTHSDDWPCFLLSDASVHRRDGSLVNQLHVDLDGPFIIRGRLEIEKDNEKYLVHRDMRKKSVWIQIEPSNAFSVGAKDDSLSVPVIWASGAAGWFELSPSKAYQSICETMFRGVCLHYSFLDQYEEALERLQRSKKKKRATFADVNLDMDELLFQYALRVGDGIVLAEAYERLHEQAIFLLSHFPKDTGVHSYLANKFPDVAQKLRDKNPQVMLEANTQPCPLQAHTFIYDKSASVETGEKKRGRGRPRSIVPTEMATGSTSQSQAPRSSKLARPNRPTTIPTIARDTDVTMTDPPERQPVMSKKSRDPRSQPRNDGLVPNPGTADDRQNSVTVLIEALQDARRQYLEDIQKGKQKKALHEISAKSWWGKLYYECNINYAAVQEIFVYYARDFVEQLGPEWHDTELYQYAKVVAESKPTFEHVSEKDIKHIVRRVKKSTRVGQTPAEKAAGESAHRQVNQYAGKQTPNRGRPSGKTSGLRPSTGGKKRPRHEDNSEEDVDIDERGILKKKAKKSHYFSGEDVNDDDEADGDESISDENPAKGERTLSENEIFGKPKDEAVAQFTLRTERLPSTHPPGTQPRGPNETWVCKEPDCGYVVRLANEEEGQKLVVTHLEQHEKEANDVAERMALDRENIALQEGTKGHMPVSHLLEKIRNLSTKSTGREKVMLNGNPVPQPIKKSLPI
ncbi:hypothetical protein GGS20DRAFT_578025 [Poronia punctata]|nr:hypothetical protein GGS20DRAFT_578025 [Poronia punctata]